MGVTPSSIYRDTQSLFGIAMASLSIDVRSAALLRVALGVYVMVDCGGNWPDRCDMFSDEVRQGTHQ